MNIFRSALSLVIHKKGDVAQVDIDQLLRRYREHDQISVDAQEYREAVDLATAYYRRRERCLFICTGRPCEQRSRLDISEQSLAQLTNRLTCPVELTGCHWLCETAPVVTLKLGETSRSFSSDTAWSSTLNQMKDLIDSYE